MFAIRTFTLLLDFEEDRLRMNACDAENTTQSVMLTRRLMDRAIPQMAGKAENLILGPIPPNAFLPLAQHALREERQANPILPVRISPSVRPWLCITMQLIPADSGIHWVLGGSNGEEARMFLSKTNLQATLDVFAQKYSAMQWDRAPFPDWLVATEQCYNGTAKAFH